MIPEYYTYEEILNLCNGFGKVKYLNVKYAQGSSYCKAKIIFENPENAVVALRDLDNRIFEPHEPLIITPFNFVKTKHVK